MASVSGVTSGSGLAMVLAPSVLRSSIAAVAVMVSAGFSVACC